MTQFSAPAGYRAPRKHHDVDLPYPAADFGTIAAFIAGDRQLTEIGANLDSRALSPALPATC